MTDNIYQSELDTRVAAAKALAKVLREGVSLTAALNQWSWRVAAKDQGLLQELCFGVARFAPAFEVLAGKLLTSPIKNKEAEVKALLFLGFYQLDHTRIPDHAAINSVVNATKLLHKPWATGLLNGVLRRYVREKETLIEQLNPNPQYRLAHPRWLLDMLKKAWPEEWQGICEANNAHPPLTLRINSQRTTRKAYSEALDKPHRLGTYSDVALTLDEATNVEALPGFSEGQFAVQDEAAQLSAGLLDLQPGLRVLDACAAPGGKSCHILEHAPALAELVAIDIDAERMTRVEQNLARLGLSATLKVGDAAAVDDWWDGQPFDRILLDAPCSATGVIRRHPDIKLLRRADDIAKLAKLQQKMLKALWPTLKSGGKLVYATCSVLPQENEKTIRDFLAVTGDATMLAIDADFGQARPHGRQLFPQEGSHDGFYYCVLHKA